MKNQPTPVPLSAIGVCFALALFASILRSYGILPVESFPILVVAFWSLPLGVFLFWYRRARAYREWIARGPRIRRVVRAQTWRVGGVLFLVLYGVDLLPAIFAVPAGVGDIIAGALAPFAARWLDRASRRPWFVVWTWFGLLDFVIVVSLVVLASPIGPLAGQETTEIMTRFPLLLIPIFLVPLWIVYHVTALDHARISPPVDATT